MADCIYAGKKWRITTFPIRAVNQNFAGHGLLGITQQVIDVICRERRELDYRQ